MKAPRSSCSAPRLLIALVMTLADACYDPVHLDAVAALGPETPGIPPGPTHRAGQPCSTCHSGDGPADDELALGGTLYAVRGSSAPLGGGSVTVTDARGESRTMVSNEAGNFFLRKSEWRPTFPLRVVVAADGVQREMIKMCIRDRLGAAPIRRRTSRCAADRTISFSPHKPSGASTSPPRSTCAGSSRDGTPTNREGLARATHKNGRKADISPTPRRDLRRLARSTRTLAMSACNGPLALLLRRRSDRS